MSSDVPTRSNGIGRDSERANAPAPPADQADERLLESIACRHAVSLPAQPPPSATWPEEKQAEQLTAPAAPAQLLRPEERSALVDDDSAELAEPESPPDEAAQSRRSLWIGLGVQVLVLLALLALAWLGFHYIRL